MKLYNFSNLSNWGHSRAKNVEIIIYVFIGASFMILCIYQSVMSGVTLTDFGYIVDASYRIFDGEIPYKDFKFLPTPLTPFIQSIILSPGNLITFRYYLLFQSLIFFIIGFSIFVYYWGLSRFSVMFAIGVSSLSPIILKLHNWSTPWYDTDACMFLLLAIVLFLYGLRGRGRIYFLFFGGVSIGLACLAKQNMGIFIGGLICIIIFFYKRKVWKPICAGLLIVIMIFFLYLWKNDAINDFVRIQNEARLVKIIAMKSNWNFFFLPFPGISYLGGWECETVPLEGSNIFKYIQFFSISALEIWLYLLLIWYLLARILKLRTIISSSDAVIILIGLIGTAVTMGSTQQSSFGLLFLYVASILITVNLCKNSFVKGNSIFNSVKNFILYRPISIFFIILLIISLLILLSHHSSNLVFLGHYSFSIMVTIALNTIIILLFLLYTIFYSHMLIPRNFKIKLITSISAILLIIFCTFLCGGFFTDLISFGGNIKKYSFRDGEIFNGVRINNIHNKRILEEGIDIMEGNICFPSKCPKLVIPSDLMLYFITGQKSISPFIQYGGIQTSPHDDEKLLKLLKNHNKLVILFIKFVGGYGSFNKKNWWGTSVLKNLYPLSYSEIIKHKNDEYESKYFYTVEYIRNK